MHRVLIVDDDAAIRETIELALTGEGYEVAHCADGITAIDVFLESSPDLVLLDWMLPGKDGIKVCREIRLHSPQVPIIMVTAKDDVDDKVLGLDSGADDYLSKPFARQELVARVRAQLRPLSVAPKATLSIGPLELDVPGHQVTRDGRSISLTPIEFKLLQTIADQPRQVFTRGMLLEHVWGYSYDDDTRLVNVHIQRLRSKIEDDPQDPKIVVTVRGIGYKAGQS